MILAGDGVGFKFPESRMLISVSIGAFVVDDDDVVVVVVVVSLVSSAGVPPTALSSALPPRSVKKSSLHLCNSTTDRYEDNLDASMNDGLQYHLLISRWLSDDALKEGSTTPSSAPGRA